MRPLRPMITTRRTGVATRIARVVRAVARTDPMHSRSRVAGRTFGGTATGIRTQVSGHNPLRRLI